MYGWMTTPTALGIRFLMFKLLTGFLSRLGLASGVKEGIQKLGRWELVDVLAPLGDPAELFSAWHVLFPLVCPESHNRILILQQYIARPQAFLHSKPKYFGFAAILCL